ncbi:putative zinc finger, CCHC-type containing protein [Tanacetum coccineum]
MIVGLTIARDIWAALEAAYNNSSVERVQNLRDQLRQTQKGEKLVAELGHSFKLIYDQLSAIRHPVDATDQVHWFLCGLGPTFETFSTYVHSSRHQPTFLDLLARAESHELFIKALHGSSPPTVAFSAQSSQQKYGSNSLTMLARRCNTMIRCNRSDYTKTLVVNSIIGSKRNKAPDHFCLTL